MSTNTTTQDQSQPPPSPPPPIGSEKLQTLSAYTVTTLPSTAYYISNFLSPSEESYLFSTILNQPAKKWTYLSHRRLQTHPAPLTPSGHLVALPSTASPNVASRNKTIEGCLISGIQADDKHKHHASSTKTDNKVDRDNHVAMNNTAGDAMIDVVDGNDKMNNLKHPDTRPVNHGGQNMSKSPDYNLSASTLSSWLIHPILSRLEQVDDVGLFDESPHKAPNHVLINEYEPGQGISKHEDGAAYWPVVVTVSLGGNVVLEVEERGKGGGNGDVDDDDKGEDRKVYRILQEPRRLVIDEYIRSLSSLTRPNIFNTLVYVEVSRIHSIHGLMCLCLSSFLFLGWKSNSLLTFLLSSPFILTVF